MMIQMIQVMNQTLGGVIAVREVIEVKIRSNIQNPEGKGKARGKEENGKDYYFLSENVFREKRN